MRALQIAFATTLLGLSQVNTASAEDKLTVGVALPRAQLGQPNGANADVAEPVRQVLMSYLKGPVIEVVALEARIPVQIAAEAKEKGCAFVLYTDVAQIAKGGGLKMLKKLAPMAGMLPMLGGGMNSQLAMSAVSQGVMQAQMQDAQEDAMANAMSAINGAQKSNVKAGDSLSLQYRLVRVGEEQPTKSSTIVVKAKANGDDVLSPMLETVATDVVGSVAGH